MDHSYFGPARDTFTEAYVNAAIMDAADRCGIAEDCGEDCNGSHTPVTLTVGNLASATLEQLQADAREFFDAHVSDLALYPGDHFRAADEWPSVGGYYFWMTRSGHGVGFGDWYTPDMSGDAKAARERLRAACREHGERDLFQGTDGKIHHGISWGEIQAGRNGS